MIRLSNVSKMNLVSFVIITMVLMVIDVQSQGLFDPLTDPLKQLGKNVGDVSKTVTDVATSLQAESICKCGEKALLSGEFKACESDGLFDIRQFAQDIARIVPTCTKLDIPSLKEVVDQIPSGLPKLKINGKERCRCAYDHYRKGQIESCKGTGLYNPIALVTEIFNLSDCKTETIN